jgi:hypothetical protein
MCQLKHADYQRLSLSPRSSRGFLTYFRTMRRILPTMGVSVVFVSSEGRMMRKLITFIDYYVLTKYYREKLVVKKWEYHRNQRRE